LGDWPGLDRPKARDYFMDRDGDGESDERTLRIAAVPDVDDIDWWSPPSGAS